VRPVRPVRTGPTVRTAAHRARIGPVAPGGPPTLGGGAPAFGHPTLDQLLCDPRMHAHGFNLRRYLDIVKNIHI